MDKFTTLVCPYCKRQIYQWFVDYNHYCPACKGKFKEASNVLRQMPSRKATD